MKTIPLTKGYFTKVDDEDYQKFATVRWYTHFTRKGEFKRAVREENGKTIYLSRLVINAPVGEYVDHINHDTLDNRKINLRLCSISQNSGNCNIRKDNTSGFKGVNLRKDIKGIRRWQANISCRGKHFSLGFFDNKEKAALAYDKAAKEKFGKFAKLNDGDLVEA